MPAAPLQDESPLQLGEVIDGTYRLIEEVGRGGFGAVYRAEHLKLRKAFAIKVLHPKHGSNDRVLVRFENEARAISRLEHPNVVQVFDVGRTPTGVAFIVMEFLRGVTLHAKYKEAREAGRALGTASVSILFQVARGLVEAHRLGIIHRDLKPANIMLVEDEDSPDGVKVKLMDFGVAKLMPGALGEDAAEVAHTSTGAQQPGTLTHMAPEQVRTSDGKMTDPTKIDVWALGVVSYQMLAGRLPFYHPETFPLMMMIVGEDFEPLDKVDPQLPPELIQLTHEMLAKDPDRRPAMQAVRDRLGRFLGRSSVSIVPLLSARSSSAPDAPVSQSSSAAEGGIAATVDAPERGVLTPTASGMGGSGPHRLSGDRSTQPPRLGRGEPIEGALSSGIARTSGERISSPTVRRGLPRLWLGLGAGVLLLGVASTATLRMLRPTQLPLKPPTETGVSGATGTPPGPAAPQPGLPPVSKLDPQPASPSPPTPSTASDPSTEGKKPGPDVAVIPDGKGKPSRGKPACNIVELSPACVSGPLSADQKNKTVSALREAVSNDPRTRSKFCDSYALAIVGDYEIRSAKGVSKELQGNFAKALRAFLRLPRLPGEIQIKCTAK